MQSKAMSLSVRVAIIVLAALIASTALVGVISYAMNRGDAIIYNADKALAVARTLAAAIDPDDFSSIAQSEEKNDAWYTYKALLDTTIVQNDILYLYVVERDNGTELTYFAEGYPPDRGDVEIDLGETETVDVHEPLFLDTLRRGVVNTTGIYESEGFGFMVSGFAPILDRNGQAVGAVGVDIGVDDVVRSANEFGVMIIAIVAGCCIVIGLLIVWFMRRSIGRPIAGLTAAAESMAEGDIEIDVRAYRRDEIGLLVESFNKMAQTSRDQARALELLASGDLTVDVTPRCERDVMSIAMERMIDNLGKMFEEIRESTEHVSSGARQMASGSQNLAEGATEQAATIAELSAAIGDIAVKTRENANMAEQASQLAETIKGNAQKGSQQMEQMVNAVREIDEASRSINKVIKVIDDIAFQTNILALNAAVEAAHAGAQGKGFAVVAEEVRSLAQKSSESAKDTSKLIASSMEKTGMGVKIADEAYGSLTEIVSGINESSRIVGEIARSSEEQSEAIRSVNTGIDQVAQVIQHNSATSQESAAASQEMSGQADILAGLIARFKLRDQESGRSLPPSRIGRGIY